MSFHLAGLRLAAERGVPHLGLASEGGEEVISIDLAYVLLIVSSCALAAGMSGM